jgi:hypothetical protein
LPAAKGYITAVGDQITATGNNNVMIGALHNDGGFGGVLMLGINDTATANSQCRFGSLSTPVGTFTPQAGGPLPTCRLWNVFINGAAAQILCV